MAQFIGLDLFAGAGGLSTGARMAGIQVLLAVELDSVSAATYAANHPRVKVLNHSIQELGAAHLRGLASSRRTKVLFGGPPCAGFSYSNQQTRSATNPSNHLYREFLRITALWRPDWIVFENVKGLADTAGGVFFQRILEGFKRLGYAVTHAVLNAADYGIPQTRNRLFIVGMRDANGRFRFPDPVCGGRVSVRDAIADLPFLANGHARSWMDYPARLSPSEYALNLRQAKGCENHLVTRNRDSVIARFKHVPQGGNWTNIPPSLMSSYSNRDRCHTGLYRRLRYCEPACVIGNFRKNMLIHPTQARGLSVREAARLQSFPDSYTFHGSIGFQQQQVSNAVPPLLAAHLFQSLVAS
jgi:DNA (cytosine-5)-methyltransferase 1